MTRSSGSRLNSFPSDEQRLMLERLSPLSATVESVIEFHFAVARAFIRRGRAPAGRTGSKWSTELESACLEHLERMLGAAPAIE